MKTCSIDGCEKPSHARGLCSMHYTRWQRHGDPLAGNTKYTDPEEAFLARAEPIVGEPAHIIWTGATNGDGYGVLRVNGRLVPAHRFAWEREHGPIPDAMFIDHMCFERLCCNVDHLRLATRAQNQQNRSGAQRGSTTGARGVYRDGDRYFAKVVHRGKQHYAGTFDTIAEASAAAATKRSILFGEFAGRA